MSYTVLLHAMLASAGYTLLYAIAHEIFHYLAALAVGAHARFGLSTDTIMPSPSVRVLGGVDGARKLFVLYAPYMFNLLALMFAPTILKIIAILTLPNMLLECDNMRGKAVLGAAVALEIVLALVAARVAMLWKGLRIECLADV
jgi:hypothetical protein